MEEGTACSGTDNPGQHRFSTECGQGQAQRAYFYPPCGALIFAVRVRLGGGWADCILASVLRTNSHVAKSNTLIRQAF